MSETDPGKIEQGRLNLPDLIAVGFTSIETLLVIDLRNDSTNGQFRVADFTAFLSPEEIGEMHYDAYSGREMKQEFKKRLENKICELLELPDVESVKSGLFIANEPFVNVIGTSLWQHIRRAVEIKGGDMEGFGVLTSQLLLKKRTLDVN